LFVCGEREAALRERVEKKINKKTADDEVYGFDEAQRYQTV
jgi:hypothetical protein